MTTQDRPEFGQAPPLPEQIRDATWEPEDDEDDGTAEDGRGSHLYCGNCGRTMRPQRFDIYGCQGTCVCKAETSVTF